MKLVTFNPFTSNDADRNLTKIDFNITFVNILETGAIRNVFDADIPF